MTGATPDPGPPAPDRLRIRWLAAIAFVVVLVVLAIAWRITPLARLADPALIAGYRDQVRDLPFAPLLVIAAFVALAFVAAPGTLMIGATMLLFGPRLGALYALAGMLVNGSVTFAVARVAARELVDRWLAARGGSRIEVFGQRLARRGFVAVMLMRLTPLPYAVQNVLAGASRIRYVDFLAGTAIGLLPVITLMAGVTTQLDAWLADPGWTRLAILSGAVIAAFGVGWWLKRWAARRAP